MLLKQHCFIALTTTQLVKDQENFEENQTEQTPQLLNSGIDIQGTQVMNFGCGIGSKTLERGICFSPIVSMYMVQCTWPGYEKWSGQSVVAIYV